MSSKSSSRICCGITILACVWKNLMFLHIIFFDTTKYYLHLVNLPWTQPIQLSYNIDAQIDIDPTKTKSRCHQNCFTGSRHTWTRVRHVYQSFLPQTLVIRLPTFKHWVHVAKIHRKTFLWQPISRCKIIYNQNWDKLPYSRIYTGWYTSLCYTYFRFQIYS